MEYEEKPYTCDEDSLITENKLGVYSFDLILQAKRDEDLDLRAGGLVGGHIQRCSCCRMVVDLLLIKQQRLYDHLGDIEFSQVIEEIRGKVRGLTRELSKVDLS